MRDLVKFFNEHALDKDNFPRMRTEKVTITAGDCLDAARELDAMRNISSQGVTIESHLRRHLHMILNYARADDASDMNRVRDIAMQGLRMTEENEKP